MSVLFNANSQLRAVQRAGKNNRFGKPAFETIESMVPCRLDRSTTSSIGPDGSIVTKDASAWIEARFDLRVKDVFVVDVARDERYNVVDVKEKLDLLGEVEFRVYGLTRQR